MLYVCNQCICYIYVCNQCICYMYIYNQCICYIYVCNQCICFMLVFLPHVAPVMPYDLFIGDQYRSAFFPFPTFTIIILICLLAEQEGFLAGVVQMHSSNAHVFLLFSFFFFFLFFFFSCIVCLLCLFVFRLLYGYCILLLYEFVYIIAMFVLYCIDDCCVVYCSIDCIL